MSVNQKFVVDGIDFCSQTPNITDGQNKLHRITSNSDNLHGSFVSDCRRSSLSVDIDTTSSDTENGDEICLESRLHDDGYFDDIFPVELELDKVSDTSSYYSSLEYQFPEQSELHNYKLLDKIGEGAFSRVFKAVDITGVDQTPVAIKVITKENILSNEISEDDNRIKSSSRKQVMNECAIHRMVSKDNPYCTKFIGFQESASYYYLVSELVTGGEIFDKIVQLTYFSEDLARHVVTQVAIAVKHMHLMGIVHRDIKPENLLFEPIPFQGHQGDAQKEDEFKLGVGGGGIGLVKLMDFGLAKRIYDNTAKTPCGTIEYTSPEIFCSKPYSMEVDMWGIGCVLFTLLCGYPPFYEKSHTKLVKKICKGDYEFLAPWWDDISSGAKNAITHLLEVDPSKRYDINDFLNDPWLNSYDCLKPSQSETYVTVDSILNGSFDEATEILHSALSYQSQKRDDIDHTRHGNTEYIYMAEEERELRGSWIGEPKGHLTLDITRSSVYRRRKDKILFW
ncbi:hypothetical protein SMKI_07G0980 [Saccharomyces mikatae IFO 1815]|uniref:Protein kinase domain-containing protein n=1 Tax=Saccharomyces mikatae IFO 1815 TaxID=226126 RepID=A0AA35J0X1_SACMI|nr:uncharacterized protein SMKI_07G0980 [Saccharomyces mikatae IFO 1815]CAI4039127.1 hypothetical protein SMKI_07G0980 [Saccharomyces mikatae IFO 1815]